MARQQFFDAYVMLSGGRTQDTQQILQEALVTGGRWSGRAVGDFDGVVAITTDNRFDLDRLIARQQIGAVLLDVLRRRGRKVCPVKRTALPPNWVEAFALINVQPGAAKSVRRQVRNLGGVAAAATVRGSADVIAHFQATNDAGLDAALGALNGVQGRVSHRVLRINQVMPPP